MDKTIFKLLLTVLTFTENILYKRIYGGRKNIITAIFKIQLDGAGN